MNKSQNKKSGNKLNKLNNLSADDEDRKMRKLFVDRLNASITEDDIYSVFSKHGEIEEVAKYQDRRAPSRYFAFVVYKYAKDCVKATYDPCPIIRGRKCNCMLAAIGKQFSGYKFFVQKGLLTEEEKQNQKKSSNNNNNNNNNKNNNNNNSNKRINNNNNKKRNNNKHNMNNNNMNVNNNTKMDNNKSHPQINIPSFKDDMNNSHHSSRSAIVSNYEDNTPVNSVNYDNYPSWHSQFDSHTSQCSYSTNISEQPLPSYNQSKSFNYNNNIRREYVPQKSLYKDPRRYNNNTPYIQYQQHSNPTTWHQYQPQQQPVSQPIPQQQQIPQYNISYSNNNAPNAPNAHFRRTRAQSMTNILPQYYTQQQQPQHNTQQQQQPTLQSYSYSQMQPQRNPPQMQPRVQYSPIIPPMTQSVSYTQLPHPPRQYTNTMSNPPPKLQYSRKQNIQQSSAPKLPGLTTNNNTTNKCNTPTPSMFKSHSARSSQSAHSIFHNDSNPPIIGDDLDLLDEFADLELTPNGLPPTPSPPPCLLLSLNAGAKPSIDIDRDEFFDTLKVPRAKTFTSVVDAKNASDKELEAGFTMLSSPTPTATASVHTEYNDSEDLHNFELNPTKN